MSFYSFRQFSVLVCHLGTARKSEDEGLCVCTILYSVPPTMTIMTSPPPPGSPPRRRMSMPHGVAPSTRRLRASTIVAPPAGYGAVDVIDHDDDNDGDAAPDRPPLARRRRWRRAARDAAAQVPAIALATLFHLMVGIPFGVSYFPVGWHSASATAASPRDGDAADDDGGGFAFDGPFPLPGKEALGIRMFLFSTVICQLIMSYASRFDNCIGLQMVSPKQQAVVAPGCPDVPTSDTTSLCTAGGKCPLLPIPGPHRGGGPGLWQGGVVDIVLFIWPGLTRRGPGVLFAGEVPDGQNSVLLSGPRPRRLHR